HRRQGGLVMDITPHLEMKPAPRAVFDSLAARRDKVRFFVPDAAAPGGYAKVTWGAFADEIRDVAMFLADALKKEDRACVYAPNRVSWASAALAIQAARGVIVPVYPASTAAQAGYVIGHSDAKVVFVDTPALLSRLFEAWDSLALVSRVVLL